MPGASMPSTYNVCAQTDQKVHCVLLTVLHCQQQRGVRKCCELLRLTCDTKRKRTTRYRLQGNGKEPLGEIYTIHGDRPLARVRAQAAS